MEEAAEEAAEGEAHGGAVVEPGGVGHALVHAGALWHAGARTAKGAERRPAAAACETAPDEPRLRKARREALSHISAYLPIPPHAALGVRHILVLFLQSAAYVDHAGERYHWLIDH